MANDTGNFAFPDMDFETEIVYFSNGTADVDGLGPVAFQGLTLTEYRRFINSGKWAFMGYTPSGEPSLGYLPKELTKAQYDLWASRIRGAVENPVAGYQDSTGLWFPGNLPNSVISAVANEARKELLERSFYNRIAPAILEEEMLLTEKQLRIDAFKSSMGISGGPMKSVARKAAPDTSSLQDISAVYDIAVPVQEKKSKFMAAVAALKAMRE